MASVEAETTYQPRYSARRLALISIAWSLLFFCYFLAKLFQFRFLATPVTLLYAVALTISFLTIAQSIRAYLHVGSLSASADAISREARRRYEGSINKPRFGIMMLMAFWALANNLQPAQGYEAVQRAYACLLAIFIAASAIYWFIHHVKEAL